MSGAEWRPVTAIEAQCMDVIRRWARAWRYGLGTLDDDDAQTMAWELQRASGWYWLIMLDVEDVMNDALERWAEHPELRALVEEATEVVALNYAAEGWEDNTATGLVLDKVAEWAKDRGIELVEAEPDLDEERGP